MKKIFLTLLVGVFFITAQSQVTFKPGVRLGLNIAKITNLNNSNSRIGINAGIFGELKLGRMYALQPELTYSQQGSEEINLDYISISLANKFYFLNEETPIYVVIAPTVDIMIEQQNTDPVGGDISFIGGLGYDFPFGLGIEARMKRGIADATNFEGFTDGKRRLNAVIQLGIVYKFGFKKQ